MQTKLVPQLDQQRATRRLRTVITILLLTLGLAVAAPAAGAAGQPPAGSPPGGPGSSETEAAGGETHQVTLLTGDVVVLHTTADGRQAVSVKQPAERDSSWPPPQIYERDGQIHVIPAEAAPYLASGALDGNLFNVTLLVRQGYHDEARSSLPLLLQAPEGAPTAAGPAVPAGARMLRQLPSIAATAVEAPKSRIRAVWEQLRGPRPAAFDARDARLAGAGEVWLDAKAHTTLADSVPQIGAPKAWAAGYDGEGVQVAVLDTGYDPTHPDLAGRVTKARNFTTDPDPAGEAAVDDNGHGTHVAATVAGSGAASGGIRRGVAPGADLWIGKVLDSQGTGTLDEIIAGMQWAANGGADVVNMSLGTAWPSNGNDPLSQAVDALTRSTGTLFVVAAGNLGPGQSTVTAPGAADEALTVGAVDKSDAPAAFSSRGPRLGSATIKPEIVAPGVNIVAARAAGTSLGNILGDYYTSLSGTSMATPHVAGAAAILAEEHPRWDAHALKTRLIATSKTLAGQPVTFQGGGRVDVAAAVADQLTVSQAVMSIEHIAPDAQPIQRTLTYGNDSDEVVHLRLDPQLHGTGVDQHQRPALRLSRRELTIRPHTSADLRVTLDPGATEPGQYAGVLVAHPAGDPALSPHTVLSFTVDGTLQPLTVNAVDRRGRPATGPVDIFNEDTGSYARMWLDNGTVTAEVPEGTYTVMTTIEDSVFLASEQTVAGDPELEINGPVTLTYDARRAEPVTVQTPRATELDQFVAGWTRTVGGRSLSVTAATGRPGQHLFAIPSKKAHNGDFRLSTQWQLTQPMLTASVSGHDEEGVLPSPRLASPGAPFVGSKALRVVDAGAGTPAEFAAVDARGKVAIVTRSGNGIDAQATAATQAGAAVLLVVNDRDQPWFEHVHAQEMPTYRLTKEVGERLRQELRTDPTLTMDLVGVQDPTYAYELVFTDPQIPARPHYHPAARTLARVVSDFRQNSPRMVRAESWVAYGAAGIPQSMLLLRNGPVVRTDFVSTDEVAWQRLGRPDVFANMYWTRSAVKQYRPGQIENQIWWGPLVHPAVPPGVGAQRVGSPVARFHDAIRVSIPHYFYGDTRYGYIQNQLGDTSLLTLRRGGEVVGKAPWPQAQFSVPAERSQYELSLEVVNGPKNFSDTSTRTRTTWRFTSGRPDDDRAVLPLVQADYDLDTNSYNEVPAGHPYPLYVTAGYQPGATGPGDFTTTVQVSYDDGATWIPAPVDDVGGRFRATVPAASVDGFASVRVVVTDSAGNRLTQEIDRAWKIADAEPRARRVP